MKDNEMFDEKDNLTPEIEDVEISPEKEEKPDFKSNKEPKKRWYVVHTYSGHENKVKVNLEKGTAEVTGCVPRAEVEKAVTLAGFTLAR